MLKSLPTVRTLLLAIGCGLGFGLATQAQTPAGVTRAYPEHQVGLRCAFDSVQQAAFSRQPGAEAQYRALLREVATMSPNAQARLLAQPDVTIPVVMHIIHTGGTDNISDAQVLDALRIINEDFSKTNPDTSDVIPFFRPRYANVGFRFRLARLDPNGNCTTGITRTYSTDTNIGDDRVKSLINWNQDRYLNIWICTNANGAGGYAYLPCSGGPVDGIVIRSAQFGSIGRSSTNNFSMRSLTHEIGHYFGLPHTWGGTNTPGQASNCGIDDGIADTPNTIGLLGACNTGFSPCIDPAGRPILSNVQNYMDYASCSKMFTTGQRAVMRATLALTCRQQLSTAANLQATGTNDGYSGGACAPIIAFRASINQVCEGGTVTFTDYSYNADLAAAGTTYNWSFPGGTPATSSLRTPTVTYATSGLYDVTLTITAAGRTGSRTQVSQVQVLGAATGIAAPLAESFETLGFPNNFPAPDLRNWASTSNSTSGSARWVRLNSSPSSLAVSDGAACVAVRSTLITATTWLTSPNLNLSSFSAASLPVLTFDRAYAQRANPVTESLQVQLSDDCGSNWTTIASFPSTQLNTMDTLRTEGFTPRSSADWQPLQVAIPASFVGSRLQLRFQLNSARGNTFYLDHVGLGLATAARPAAAARYSLRLYPNPGSAETALYLTLPTAANMQVRVTDVMGREVLTLPLTRLAAGEQKISLSPASNLAPGLYLVQATVEGQLLTTKLFVR